MREKTIESKLAEKVKSMGGIALKISSTNFDGMPDRLVLNRLYLTGQVLVEQGK